MKKENEKQEKISQTVTLNVFLFLLFYVEKFGKSQICNITFSLVFFICIECYLKHSNDLHCFTLLL